MRAIIDKEISLLEALASLAPQSSRNTLRGWLKDGRVTVDGKTVFQAQLVVQKGSNLEIIERRVKKEGILKILYEDDHLVVVDKPSGLLSVATNFEGALTAHGLLKNRYAPEKVFVIHRLDQDTSGVMVFARTHEAYVALKNDLALRDVKRVYYAIVEGPLKGSGTWTSYLQEDKNYHVHADEDPESGGEKAVTHYESVTFENGYTLVRFELETGKKNQIRVQAESAGYPIAGDKKYGAVKRFAKRLCLHAKELTFVHPITQERMLFEAPLPHEFFIKIPGTATLVSNKLKKPRKRKA